MSLGSGIASGVSTGSVLGPYGAVIGGIGGGILGALKGDPKKDRVNQDVIDKLNKQITATGLAEDKVASDTQQQLDYVSDAESGAIAQAASQGAQASLNSGLGGGDVNSNFLSAVKANMAVSPAAQQAAAQKGQVKQAGINQSNQLRQQKLQQTETLGNETDRYTITPDTTGEDILNMAGKGAGLLEAMNTSTGGNVTQPKIEDIELNAGVGQPIAPTNTEMQQDLPSQFTGDAPAMPMEQLSDAAPNQFRKLTGNKNQLATANLNYSKSARMAQGIEGKNNKGIGGLMNTINSNPVLNSITGKVVNNPTLSPDDSNYKINSNMSGSQTIDDARNKAAYQAKYGKSGVPYNPKKVYY